MKRYRGVFAAPRRWLRRQGGSSTAEGGGDHPPPTDRRGFGRHAHWWAHTPVRRMDTASHSNAGKDEPTHVESLQVEVAEREEDEDDEGMAFGDYTGEDE